MADRVIPGSVTAFRTGVLASLAMTAALFHCVSHAMLKSLLFCGAGAVLNATGLRDIELTAPYFRDGSAGGSRPCA